MSKHRDDIVMKDIINAAQLIAAFVDGLGKDHFIDDLKTRSAVLYQLTVIGEAVKRFSRNSALHRHKFPGHQWQECATILSMLMT